MTGCSPPCETSTSSVTGCSLFGLSFYDDHADRCWAIACSEIPSARCPVGLCPRHHGEICIPNG